MHLQHPKFWALSCPVARQKLPGSWDVNSLASDLYVFLLAGGQPIPTHVSFSAINIRSILFRSSQWPTILLRKTDFQNLSLLVLGGLTLWNGFWEVLPATSSMVIFPVLLDLHFVLLLGTAISNHLEQCLSNQVEEEDRGKSYSCIGILRSGWTVLLHLPSPRIQVWHAMKSKTISVQVITFPFLRGENGGGAVPPSVSVPNRPQYHYPPISPPTIDVSSVSDRIQSGISLIPLMWLCLWSKCLKYSGFYFSFNNQRVPDLKSYYVCFFFLPFPSLRKNLCLIFLFPPLSLG